jgi:uncharacterized protein (TIGR02246 family)
MKGFKQILTLSTVLVTACTSNQNKQSIESTQHIEAVETITSMSNARAKAFNEGDAAGIARYFSDDAFLMAPETGTLRGKEAVLSYYQSIFDAYETFLESGYEDVVVDDDLAYGRGFARVTLIDKKSGDSLFSTSKYLNILEKRDGKWVTTHDIWNGNEPIE